MVSRNKHSISLSGESHFKFEIVFTDDIFASSNTITQIVQKKKLILVVDVTVYKLYKAQIDALFQSLNTSYYIIPLEVSEAQKEMNVVLNLVREADKFGMRRDSLFIAMGGGIVTDIVGLLASIYRRGIEYVRIPTTLLGAIDSGIGIKTGVNFESRKSLIGTFYPPTYSIISSQFLATLPLPQIRNGLFELLKATLVMDKNLTIQVEKNLQSFLNREPNIIVNSIIKDTADLMVHDLNKNIFEHSYKRILDFGHTFSGYIEASSSYKISHGEAVGMDILMSAHISYQKKLLSKDTFNHIVKLFQKVGFTHAYKVQFADHFFSHLTEIQNHRAGDLNMVLLKDIGVPVITNECNQQEIQKAIDFLKKIEIFC